MIDFITFYAGKKRTCDSRDELRVTELDDDESIVQYLSTDRNQCDDTTTHWFSTPGGTFGIVELDSGATVLDADGCPVSDQERVTWDSVGGSTLLSDILAHHVDESMRGLD